MGLISPGTPASPTCALGLLASAISAVARRRDAVERCQCSAPSPFDGITAANNADRHTSCRFSMNIPQRV